MEKVIEVQQKQSQRLGFVHFYTSNYENNNFWDYVIVNGIKYLCTGLWVL